MFKSDLFHLSKKDFLRFMSVFFVALPVIALETVAFQTLSFVNDYMTAIQVISIALLGISLGGLISFFIPREKSRTVDLITLILLPLVIMSAFPIIIRLNGSPMMMMALLTGPYILASLYISLAFNEENPGYVYLFDLVGAGAGAVVAIIAVPFLREEGSFFLLGILASIPMMIVLFVSKEPKPDWAKAIGLIPAVISFGLLITHLIADPFNMIWTARAPNPEFADKVFNYMKNDDGTLRWKLHYSRGSLIERIDIIQRVGEKRVTESVYNGRRVDGITRNPSKLGILDYRLPTRLRLGKDPETLLVGPSGQGLCKAVQALGDGHVDAVEINGAIAGLMTNELFEASGYAYRGFNLTIGDVRTFIERTKRQYDFITMLNTHRIWSMGHLGAPEYIHTIEAMRKFVEHLKDDGFLIIEERNINEQADLGIRRLLHTAKVALKESGVKDPSKHIMVWERYHNCVKDRMFADPPQCNRRSLFTFIGIKKTPITDAEYEHLIEWEQQLAAVPTTKDHKGFLWRYLPQQPTKHYWTEVVQKDNLFDTPNTDRNLHNLAVITDDKPFPFDVFLSRDAGWKALKSVSILAIIMVLFPTLFAFFALRKKQSDSSNTNQFGINAILILYFAILGIAYLVVEVALIQKFGFFLSSPVWSLAIVLSTMLVFSGIGGYVFRDISPKKGLTIFGILIAIGLVLWATITPILSALISLPFILRIVSAILILGPLSFLMGVPFPFAMSLAKKELTARHAGLFFGINGAFGATASPLTILLSMALGFQMTLLIGIGAYALCALFIAATLLFLKNSSSVNSRT